MKRLLFSLWAGLALAGCQTTEDASWAAFKKCGSNACVQEALAVKDALLKSPNALLKDFLKTYEQGEDHLIGWLYLMRDSVLTNPETGTYEERVALRDKILTAVQPYTNDSKLGEIARVIAEELESIAFTAEVEDYPLYIEGLVFNGTYAFERGEAGGSGELRISEQDGGGLRFRLLVVGAAPAHNQGEISGTATFVSPQEARFTTQEFGAECTLRFTWSGDTVRVITQQGGPAACGLGAGVMPDGVYTRKSYDDPFLSAADAKSAALLQGEWQSAQDPKASIRIAEGKLFQFYDDEAVEPPVRCLYFPKCPASCSPAAQGPCLKVIGQDEVCYTVVKADGKVLELSLIGGTGNTNQYVRRKSKTSK